jgi:[ribosomal protein S5]-alanine N-acetyltransferase
MVDLDKVFTTFPVLETERLRLRMIEPRDATAVFEIFGDEDVTRFYGLETYTGLEQAAERVTLYRQNFAKRISIRWAVTWQGEDRLLGTVGIMNWKPRFFSAAVGYDVAKQYWRQGIMCEALTAVLHYAFSTMEMNRIEAFVMPENEPSRRLLEKLAFQNEGLMREYGYWRGAFHDLLLYALLKGDWRLEIGDSRDPISNL